MLVRPPSQTIAVCAGPSRQRLILQRGPPLQASSAGLATPSSRILLPGASRGIPATTATSMLTLPAGAVRTAALPMKATPSTSRLTPAPVVPKKAKPKDRAISRGKDRRAKYISLSIVARAKGLSILQLSRAGDRTRSYLDRVLATFETWCCTHRVPMQTFDHIDKALVEYLDWLFFQGAPAEQGDKLMCALAHRHPEMNRNCPADPFRARAAMKGFRKLARGSSRAPLPKAGLMALVGAAIFKKQFQMALGLLIGWAGYLRLPSDLVRMTGASLILPAPALNVMTFGLLLYPTEGEELGKTQINDESILLDTPEMLAMASGLHALKRQSSEDKPLWTFTATMFYAKFRELLSLSGLQQHISPYQIRHGTASADALSKTRTLAEIQERLRHATDVSTRRYKNATRYLAELHRLSPAVQAFGTDIEKNIVDYYYGRKIVPTPPGLLAGAPLKQRRL